jgi:hypothetical protein
LLQNIVHNYPATRDVLHSAQPCLFAAQFLHNRHGRLGAPPFRRHAMLLQNFHNHVAGLIKRPSILVKELQITPSMSISLESIAKPVDLSLAHWSISHILPRLP